MLGYLSLMSVWVELAQLAEPPGADPHAVVVWGGCPETGILTRLFPCISLGSDRGVGGTDDEQVFRSIPPSFLRVRMPSDSDQTLRRCPEQLFYRHRILRPVSPEFSAFGNH